MAIIDLVVELSICLVEIKNDYWLKLTHSYFFLISEI